MEEPVPRINSAHSESAHEQQFADIKSRRLLELLVLCVVSMGFLYAVLEATSTKDEKIGLLIFTLFVLIATALIIGWIWHSFRRNGIDLNVFIGRLPKGFKYGYLIRLIIALLLFNSVMGVLQGMLLETIIPPGAIDADAGTGGADFGTPLPLWLFPIGLVVLAPVTEELMFRGFLLHRWSYKWNLRTAIWATSIFFAFLHASWVGALTVGLVMCVLYIRTRSLLIPMIAHALNNSVPAFFITLAALFNRQTFVDLSQSAAEEPPEAGVTFFIIIGVILVISGTHVIRFLVRNWPSEGMKPPYFTDLEKKPEPLDWGSGGRRYRKYFP